MLTVPGTVTSAYGQPCRNDDLSPSSRHDAAFPGMVPPFPPPGVTPSRVVIFTSSYSTVLAGGIFPGPLVRGTKNAASLTDPSMNVATSIHWHGLFPQHTNYVDGPSEMGRSTCLLLHPWPKKTWTFLPVTPQSVSMPCRVWWARTTRDLYVRGHGAPTQHRKSRLSISLREREPLSVRNFHLTVGPQRRPVRK
ncbi:hypothetical protein BJV78DRAFT_283887 [Lactifluus subvellereus]|nr:hypothetical protein BJV78DRAFT_283887 [Lactifluus subvellereus]